MAKQPRANARSGASPLATGASPLATGASPLAKTAGGGGASPAGAKTRPNPSKRRRAKPPLKGASVPAAPPAPIVDHAALRARKLVALAEIARPHGIAGELRLKVYNPDSDLLLRRPRVLLVFPDGTEREAAISAAREVDRALLIRLAEVVDRNGAEALRGAAVCVPRSTLPPPEEGEFYAWDVVGARAVLGSGELVGSVAELASYPTCSVLVVTRPDGSHIEVPLVPAYVARIDTEAGVVELETVDGLE
jgi:16S rRNA processing protein RimM